MLLTDTNETTGMISIDIPYSFAIAHMQIPISAFPDGAKVIPLNERHITLKYLGEITNLDLDTLKNALSTFTATEHAFEIDLLGEDRFYSNEEKMDILYHGVKSKELISLRARLCDHLQHHKISLPDPYPTYYPHVTIAHIPPAASLTQEVPIPGQLIGTSLTLHFGEQTHTYPLITPEALLDLKKWREKAVRAGKAVEFSSDYIPLAVSNSITDNLATLPDYTPASIKSIFKPYLNHAEHVS